MFGIHKDLLGEIGLLAVVVIYLGTKLFEYLKAEKQLAADAVALQKKLDSDESMKRLEIERVKAEKPPVCPVARIVGEEEYELMARQVSDLWVWHSKEDENGKKVWYSDNHLTLVLEKLATATETQTLAMAKQTSAIIKMETNLDASLKLIARDIDEIKRHSKS